MVLFEIFDLSLFVYQLTLFVLQLFFSNNPVVVDSLTLLLEVSKQLLLLLVCFLKLSQLFSHR